MSQLYKDNMSKVFSWLRVSERSERTSEARMRAKRERELRSSERGARSATLMYVTLLVMRAKRGCDLRSSERGTPKCHSNACKTFSNANCEVARVLKKNTLLTRINF